MSRKKINHSIKTHLISRFYIGTI